jgi:hypothetical protein
MKSIQHNGRIWVWSWNLTEGDFGFGKLSAIKQNPRIFTPPLFEWYKS